jgi:transposase
MVESMSERAAATKFGISRKTVSKMVHHAVPPGYQRKDRPAAPKLGAFVGIIHQILLDDRDVLKKQRHTAKRIFERLRDEYQYAGGYTVVRGFVAKERLRQQEVFIPLAHPPDHAQVDFGEADIYLGGIKTRVHYFCMDLPQSDAIFVKAYPQETTDAFLDGHVAAFAWLGGVPKSVLYDNTKIAVARILGDGKRKRTKAFSELQSHYLFEDRFGRPAIAFATKPEIALAQMRQAMAAGVLMGVVLADAGYGDETAFRDAITELDMRYAVGIRPATTVWAPGTAPLPPKAWSGRGIRPTKLRREPGNESVAVKALALALPVSAWSTVAWREGSNSALSGRFAAVRVRPAHRDYLGTQMRPEEWLLIEWPEGEVEPVK